MFPKLCSKFPGLPLICTQPLGSYGIFLHAAPVGGCTTKTKGQQCLGWRVASISLDGLPHCHPQSWG